MATTTANSWINEVKELKDAVKQLTTTIGSMQTDLAQVKFGFRIVLGLYITLFAPVIVGAILFSLSKVFGP